MEPNLTSTVRSALGIAGTSDIAEMPEALPRGLVRVEDDDHVRLTGVRHGRQVVICLACGLMVTWVRAAVPDLQALGNSAGAFVVDAGAPPAGAAMLTALGGVPEVWRDVRVRAGAEGLVALRRSGASGHLYDLWLLELLAHRLDAIPLPPADAKLMVPPYRSG